MLDCPSQGQPGGWESVMLERYAGVRSFSMCARWDRKLVATVKVGSNQTGGRYSRRSG
jgi:hypothetical protein